MTDILQQLREVERRQTEGHPYPLFMRDRTYHLCMEDRYLSAALSLWTKHYKPCPLTIRDAQKGIEGSIVISVRDEGGCHIDFITRLVELTHPRVAVK